MQSHCGATISTIRLQNFSIIPNSNSVLTPLNTMSSFLPQAWHPPFCFHLSEFKAFGDLMWWDPVVFVFCVWLISLGIMSFRFIHIGACVRSPCIVAFFFFFFLSESCCAFLLVVLW